MLRLRDFIKTLKRRLKKNERFAEWIRSSQLVKWTNSIISASSLFLKMPMGFFLYKKDMKTYDKMLENALSSSKRFKIEYRTTWPRYTDRWAQNGDSIGETYFFTTTYIARQIIDNKPEHHYDIGSNIEHFISKLMAARIPTTIIDIRPFKRNLEGVSFLQSNAQCLNKIQDNSVTSLSSIYAVEHYGLGRYGDPVDPDGWYKGMTEMQRILARGG